MPVEALFPAGSWGRKCRMARNSLAVGSEMPRLVPGFVWQMPIASRCKEGGEEASHTGAEHARLCMCADAI